MAEIRRPSPRRGTNLPRMGDFNLTVILDAIRRAPAGLSRVELAQIVGLSPQTISNISRRLLDQHLIVEAGKEGTGPGKPRTMLRLNSSGQYAVGVHLDPAVTTFVVLDLVGAVVKHSRINTPAGADPDAVIGTIAAEIKQLIAGSGVEAARIAGLGVASPGPVDLAEGIVVDPPLLPGWHSVPLRDALAAATGLSTLVDKDATSAAVAEAWAGGPSGAGSFIFMYLGTGIGCGIVLNDEVVRGTSGNAGEIGHIVVDPDGPPCDCGQRGCVNVTCIPPVLVAQAEAAGVLPVPAAPPTPANPPDLPAPQTDRRSRSALPGSAPRPLPGTGRPGRSSTVPPCSWRGPSQPSPMCWTWTAWSSAARSGPACPSSTWNGFRTSSGRAAPPAGSTRSKSWAPASARMSAPSARPASCSSTPSPRAPSASCSKAGRGPAGAVARPRTGARLSRCLR